MGTGASGRTGLHSKSCPDPKDDDEDDQGDEAGMQPAVAPVGDGKHDKNEDEGANKLEREMGICDSFNVEVHFGQDGYGLSLHRKSNWLMTRRRASPKIFTTVRYRQEREKHKMN